jgi:Flp pilus assembly protein TadB
MSVLQPAILAGLVAGLGAAMIIVGLVPAQPDLKAALARLQPDQTAARRRADHEAAAGDATDRIGLWLMRRTPVVDWLRVPRRDLAILRIGVHHYLGEKALFAAVGLIFPSLLTAGMSLMGISVPIVIPAFVALGLAVAMSFIPDLQVRERAASARAEFARALGAYTDLVALARAAGSGSTAALATAAQVADSWVFVRLREELARAELAGVTPWDALDQLADELKLPELAELAAIARQSGEEGVSIIDTLRARATSLRTQLLADEQAHANAVGERMYMPGAALALVLTALLAAPPMIRIFTGVT